MNRIFRIGFLIHAVIGFMILLIIPLQADASMVSHGIPQLDNTVKIECYSNGSARLLQKAECADKLGFVLYLFWILVFINAYKLIKITKLAHFTNRGRNRLNLEAPGCAYTISEIILAFGSVVIVDDWILSLNSVGLVWITILLLVVIDIIFINYETKKKKEDMQNAYDSIQISKKVNYVTEKATSTTNNKSDKNTINVSPVATKKANNSYAGITDIDLLRIALAITISDGVVDENELKSVESLFNKSTSFNVKEEIPKQISKLKTQKNALQFVLATTSIPRDRNLLVKLVDIAGADGQYSESEKKFLVKLAQKMGVSESELEEIIKSR